MIRRYLRKELSPWQWCLVILAIVFICEFMVMLFLPFLQPANSSPTAIALVDAGLLMAVLVPLFWWMIVRPLDRMAKKRAELLSQFINVQEEERGRIARDLHDEIGQSFTSVLLGLRTFDFHADSQAMHNRVNELATVVNDTLQEVRRLARGLRPSVLDHLGLTQAIEQYLEDYQANQPVEVRLETAGEGVEGRFPAKVEISLYRIVQECMTNIARHAHAQHVIVEFKKVADLLLLSIKDDGQGFNSPPDLNNARSGSSMGLLGIAERVAALQGTFQLESSKGHGTQISISIPLNQSSAA
jgi:signal transduction histidine kinase